MEQTQLESTPLRCGEKECECPARWKRRVFSPDASTYVCEKHWQELYSRSQMSAGLYERIQPLNGQSHPEIPG